MAFFLNFRFNKHVAKKKGAGSIVQLIMASIFMILFLSLPTSIIHGIVRKELELNKLKDNCVELTTQTVRELNEDQLIYVCGKLNGESQFHDAILNKSTNAILFECVVEMYQWVRVKRSSRRVSGSRYEKHWENTFMVHSKEKYRTPRKFPYKGYELCSGIQQINGYDFDQVICSKIIEKERVKLDKHLKLSANYANKTYIKDDYVYWPLHAKDTEQRNRDEEPEIGDVRIAYYAIPEGKEVSLLCGVSLKNNKVKLIPYQFKNPKISNFSFAANGFCSSEELFEQYRFKQMTTIRLLYIFIMFPGLLFSGILVRQWGKKRMFFIVYALIGSIIASIEYLIGCLWIAELVGFVALVLLGLFVYSIHKSRNKQQKEISTDQSSNKDYDAESYR